MDHVRHVQLTARGLELLCASVHVSRTTTELLMRGHLSPVHVRHVMELSLLGGAAENNILMIFDLYVQ